MADGESRDDAGPREPRISIRYLPFDCDGRRLHAQVRSTQFTNQWCAPPKDGHYLSIATLGTPESGLSWWTLQVPRDRKLEGTRECDDVVDTESYVQNVTPFQAQRWFERNAMGVPEILLRHISRALEAWRIVNSHPEIHDRIESVRASGRSFAANLFEGIGSLSCTEIAMLLVDLDVLYQVNHDFGLRDEFRERGLRAYWRWIEEQIEHINISRDDADGKAGEAERPPIDRAISVPLPENSISRDGDVWRFRFKGKDLPVMQHTQGLLYIAILIFNKNSSVPTRQLEGRIPAFGADEVIDAEGAQSLHESIMEKRAELEEAKEQGDIGRSELLSEQIGIEERELISATGLGGRRRKLSEDAERSRGRVGKAIGLALSKIESASRPLHEHLRSTLKGRRGRNPCYQGGQIEWEISPMALARGDHPVRVREAEAPFLGA